MAKRLMVIKYYNDEDAARLKTCLDMCCVPYVSFREYEFVGGGALWRFFIDRGRLTWDQVKDEVNRVRAVPFRYVSGMSIKNGILYDRPQVIYVYN